MFSWAQTRDKANSAFLLGPKVTYFTLNLSYYASQTFVITFAKQELKVNVAQFGIYTSTLTSLAHFFGAPFWTWLADRYGRHRFILILASLLYAAAFQLFIAFPYFQLGATGNLVGVTIVNAMQTFFSSAMFPLCDNQVMSYLAKDERFSKDLFGRQRLWGSIGHGLSTLVTGVIAASMGYPAMFMSGGAFTLVFIVTVLAFIPSDKGTDKCDEIPEEKTSTPTFDEKKALQLKESTTSTIATPQLESNAPAEKPATIFSLLSNSNYTFFLFVIFITGLSKHILSVFTAEFIKDKFKMHEGKTAMALAMHAFPEVALFFCGKWLLKNVGVHWMLISAQIATVIRVMAFAYVPATWQWAPYLIETMKGVSTSFLIMSAVRIAHDVAPKGLEAIAQGAYNAVFQGLSSAGSGLLGGLLIMAYDKDTLFILTGFVSIIATALLMIKWTFFDHILFQSLRRSQ
jgi:MFS family permease